MSGLKLFWPILLFSFFVPSCLVNSFAGILVFVWHDLIMVCKMICFDKVFSRHVSYWNMKISGKCISQGHHFNTHINQISLKLKKLFIKLKHLIWFIIEYVYVYQQHTPSCTWMSRTTPPWSSAPGTRVRSSPGSPVQWRRHPCTWFYIHQSDQSQIFKMLLSN